jgi:hypothetical protein
VCERCYAAAVDVEVGAEGRALYKVDCFTHEELKADKVAGNVEQGFLDGGCLQVQGAFAKKSFKSMPSSKTPSLDTNDTSSSHCPLSSVVVSSDSSPPLNGAF